MKDLVTNGNGDSRFLKSAIPDGTTWEEALALFRSGQFPIDLNGLNLSGISQQGSAYSKANVLPDAICTLLGIDSSSSEPKDAFNALIQKSNTVTADLNTFKTNDWPYPYKIGVARSNLLDNWYFVGGGSQAGAGRFPINQNEATSQTAAGYFCDRWRKANTNGTTSLTANGMSIVGTGSAYNYMNQPIEFSNRLFGKQVTVSMLNTSGALVSVTATLPSALPSATTSYGTSSAIGNVRIKIMGSASYFYVEMDCQASSSTAIQAVKLELGPNQSLARQVGSTWVLNELPDYATELQKCQRYMVVIRGTGTGIDPYFDDIVGFCYHYTNYNVAGFISLPVTMRTTPAVTFNCYYFTNGNGYDNWSISLNGYTLVSNGIGFYGSGHSASDSARYSTYPVVRGYNKTIFDANL